MKARGIFILILALSSSFMVQARKKPLIGVAPGYNGERVSTLNRSYTDAILRAGGIPVILPQVNNPAEAAEMVSRVDGVVLTGGLDMNPAYYGESVLNESVEIDAVASNFSMLCSADPSIRTCPPRSLGTSLTGSPRTPDSRPIRFRWLKGPRCTRLWGRQHWM